MNNFCFSIIAIVGIIACVVSWVLGVGFTVALGAFLLKSVGVTALHQVTFGIVLKFLIASLSVGLIGVAAKMTLGKNK